MKRYKRTWIVLICAVVCLVWLVMPALSGERMTIEGVVNESYQIVTDNEEVYEVGETEKGDEVVELVDRRVRVTGMVEESDGDKVIEVTSYEVLE